MNYKEFILKRLPIVAKIILWYKDRKRLKRRITEIEKLKSISTSQQLVFYLGIPTHPNLGDMGQFYCIKNWLKDNYPDAKVIMLDCTVVTDSRVTGLFLNELKRLYKSSDIILFQSGYCTQDLGGEHTKMHEIICENLPDAKILMMPQTVNFVEERNRAECSENHNKAKNMMFLARDMVSYEQAKKMFSQITVLPYPDIVTTLIGSYSFGHKRDGICLCTRNDGEKLYSDTEFDNLSNRFIEDNISVFRKDTQSSKSVEKIHRELQKCIENEIESYSHFELTITDRYHGTIFSLCAGTPVIIVKSSDHKVITGADWFKGIYDDYVYVADSLEDAYSIAKEVLTKHLDHALGTYFQTNYYDTLKEKFEACGVN